MQCRVPLLMACCCIVLGGHASVWADTREALVIGNAKYADVPLKNPPNDAQAMDKALRQLGFSTRLLQNADWKTMIEAVRAFLIDSTSADVRLVYYAGHGAQVRGHNFLIPVDAPLDNTDELTARSLNVAEILSRFARNRKGVSILILDACRNNPGNQYQLLSDGRRVKVRGAQPGLAPLQAPAGTLVAFSTSPGNVADDRPDLPNSVYTRRLLEHIATPGIPLEQMFKRVRIDVMNDSKQQQVPWEESSLRVEYCLKPAASGNCPGR
jgi:uncharacterized caspase-like protein